MTPKLYGHPFSSYTWKALIGLYEASASFEFCKIGPDEPENTARLQALWPLAKFPVLEAHDGVWLESSAIVEWADRRRTGGPPLIPTDPTLALEARMLDRVCDGYVMNAMQATVDDRLRPEGQGDAYGAERGRAVLAKAYAWLDARLEAREWLVGEDFSLADVSGAPALFYADWIVPLTAHVHLAAYLRRLRDRPSVKRCVDEARPFRAYFPGGVPAHAD